jgi:dual specificity tyrosine-phosphorylation-regulated kinase 2/3/4
VYELHDHVAYRYEILQKMGKGSYGEVLKVFDHKKKEHLALKIVRNKTKFNQQAFVEIQLLTHVKEKDADHTSNIVKIKDFIIFRKHVCIVF